MEKEICLKDQVDKNRLITNIAYYEAEQQRMNIWVNNTCQS